MPNAFNRSQQREAERITFQKEGTQTRVYFEEEDGGLFMSVVLFKRGADGWEMVDGKRYPYTREFESLLEIIAGKRMDLQ